MKSLELKPTYENLLNTLIEDTIGRNKDVCMFADIINSASDSCSIALDGSWGSGKTFFVKQTKMLLDANNPFIESMPEEDCEAIKSACNKKKTIDFEPQVCVYYDAWENDNDSEPILSLIYSIVNSVSTDFVFSKGTGFLPKAAAILEFFTDKNWQDIIDSFKRTSPFEELKTSKDIQKKIKEFLDSLLPEQGNRLVIFIDELDRCKPSYAVRLLERIKHYFENDRITFVFSINALELQHTIKKHYGENFDACRYLDRFFDIRVAMPKLNLSDFYYSIGFNNTKYTFDTMCDVVIKKYNFSIREIAKYLRLTKMAAYNATHDNGNFNFHFNDGRARKFCLLYILPILMGLYVYNRDEYEQFISGKNHTPLTEIFLTFESYFFKDLLNADETYDKEETSKTFVTFEDKIKAIYYGLFSNESNTDENKIVLGNGNYRFDKVVKEDLLQATSLLSNYATLYSEEN